MAGLQVAAGRLAAAGNPSIFEAGSDAQCSRRQSRQPTIARTWKYLIEMTRLSSSTPNSISVCLCAMTLPKKSSLYLLNDLQLSNDGSTFSAVHI